MICKNCGYKNKKEANFCIVCGTRLKKLCNCWVKKEPYDCGQDKCPGIKLFLKKPL